MRGRFVVIDARRETGDAPHRNVGLDGVPCPARRRRLERHPAEAVDVDPRLHAPGEAEQRRQRLERQRAASEPAPGSPRAQRRGERRADRRRRQRVHIGRRRVGTARHGARRRRLARPPAQGRVGQASGTEADIARRVVEEAGHRVPGAPPGRGRVARIGARGARHVEEAAPGQRAKEGLEGGPGRPGERRRQLGDGSPVGGGVEHRDHRRRRHRPRTARELVQDEAVGLPVHDDVRRAPIARLGAPRRRCRRSLAGHAPEPAARRGCRSPARTCPSSRHARRAAT